jgi:hypothetical protein
VSRLGLSGGRCGTSHGLVLQWARQPIVRERKGKVWVIVSLLVSRESGSGSGHGID